MPPQDDPVTESESHASNVGAPLIAVGAFAAGAVATLLAKRLIDARRKAGDATDEVTGGDDGSQQDLATVLRRAALDVAVLATGQAAERLRSQDDASEAEPEAVSSDSS